MKKRVMGSVLLGLCMVIGCSAPAMADSRRVVTLGADLDGSQRDTMMRYFGVTYDGVDIIYINNDDEREHLGSYVPLEQIGTRTYSCALVSPTSSGGIKVKTANLDWVTCNMIASTLSTSGVTNCQVVAAAPFKVSGTGALTGVIMAYETASKQTLDPKKKELANQELVTTCNLSEELGQSTATAIINEAKIKVIENNITDYYEINNIVNNISVEYNVTIPEEQNEEIVGMLQEIGEEEYDVVQMKATLDRVQANVIGDAGASEEKQLEAEKQAEVSEQAALDAVMEEQQEDDGSGIVLLEDMPEQEENILDNTDVGALEESGIPVEEGDTTSTVLEQEKKEEEVNLGIPDATDDGSIVLQEIPGEENNEGQIAEEEKSGIELIEESEKSNEEQPSDQNEEVTDGQTSVPEEAENTPQEEKLSPDDLDMEDRDIYNEATSSLDRDFATTTVTNEDGSYSMTLTEDAADLIPEKLEAYLLKVLLKGAEAVAQEEMSDPSVSQTIFEDTQNFAPDAHYTVPELVQLDRYVRRLIFKDSEKILEDSYLDDTDRSVLYDVIMRSLEKAFDVEPESEEIPGDDLDIYEDMPADSGEDFDLNGESYDDSLSDGEMPDAGLEEGLEEEW